MRWEPPKPRCDLIIFIVTVRRSPINWPSPHSRVSDNSCFDENGINSNTSISSNQNEEQTGGEVDMSFVGENSNKLLLQQNGM